MQKLITSIKWREKIKWKLSNTYCDLPERFYSYLGVSDFPNPKLLYFHQNLANELGIKEDMAQLSKNKKM